MNLKPSCPGEKLYAHQIPHLKQVSVWTDGNDKALVMFRYCEGIQYDNEIHYTIPTVEHSFPVSNKQAFKVIATLKRLGITQTREESFWGGMRRVFDLRESIFSELKSTAHKIPPQTEVYKPPQYMFANDD